MSERVRKNIRHRLIEMDLTTTDIATVLGCSRSAVHDRLQRMTDDSIEIMHVLLVLPPGALLSEHPASVLTYALPDMGAWHAAMTSVLKDGKPYPSVPALLTYCAAAAIERERGVLYSNTDI